MTITTTKLYQLLSEKQGKEIAEATTTFIEEKIKDEYDRNNEIIASKLDLERVRLDLVDRIQRNFYILLTVLLTVGIGFAVNIMARQAAMETILKIIQEKVK